MTTEASSAAPEPQSVIAPLTGAAIFLVVVVNPGEDSVQAVRDLCADLAGLVRAVGFRDLEGHLSCVTGLGATGWDRIAGADRPVELHSFREIKAGPRHAVATPGDVLFHIRAEQMLVNMFIGAPEANYDRLLDFSTAVTGCLFFVPAVPLLESLGAAAPGHESGAGPPANSGPAASPPAPGPHVSLKIGSLKGAPGDG